MIDLFRPFMDRDQALRALFEVLGPDENGRVYIGQGAKVEEFERALKTVLGASQDVLTLNSCTSALDLALHLCNVIPRPVNEPTGWQFVISTPMTCTATNGPIVTRGASIMWADVDPLTGLIDPLSVKDRINRCVNIYGTVPKAIMAVDWGGHLCDYAALRAVTEPYAISIIQDAAHSFGSTRGGGPFLSAPVLDERVAWSGDYTCFSFQAIKALTTGDGGALVCSDEGDTERARLLRWYGLDRRSNQDFRCQQMIQEVGYKYHMNDIAATLGLVNLPHVDWMLAVQRANANFYGVVLDGLEGVILPPSLCDRSIEPGGPEERGRIDNNSAFWLFTLLVSDRDSFTSFMMERGIMVSPVHARNDVHPGFQESVPDTHAPDGGVQLPGVDFFAAHEVAIPVGWWINADERGKVAIAVQDWSRLHGVPLEPPKTR